MKERQAKFIPAWWLRGAHGQTIWPTLLRRKMRVLVEPEHLELPDGDFLDLAWVGKNNSGPIVVVLHGLTGSIKSPYALGILQAISACGWRAVFMHFRGCSGIHNRLARSYHSGETGDLQFVINELRKREENIPLAAIGFSLGGNVLLKWLGETGGDNPLSAAIAISVPFDLQHCADHFNQGASRFYQWWLLRQLRTTLKNKFKKMTAPIALHNLHTLRSFWDFDDKVTAPLHGFQNALDYYQQSSSRQFLRRITVPTLILQAQDDPFVPHTALPQSHELSPHITLELTLNGGHVGFIAGKLPWKPVYWLEQKVINFLQEIFTTAL
jgi:uncharacterized protein